MEAQQRNQKPADQDDRNLMGGTEEGDVAPLISKGNMAGGTRATTAPSGDIHPEPPSQAIPRTPTGEDQPGHAPKEHGSHDPSSLHRRLRKGHT